MTKAQRVAVGCLFAVPVLCCLGGIVGSRLFLIRAKSRLGDDIERAHSMGMPVNLSDLHIPKVPDSQNAAPYYQRAANELEHDKGLAAAIKKIKDDVHVTPTVDQQRDADLQLALLKPVMTLLDKGTSMPECRYFHRYDHLVSEQFPEYKTFKDFARLYRVRADQKSRAGDWKGALADMAREDRLYRHTLHGQTVISLLIGVACAQLAMGEYEPLLNRHGHDPEFVRALKAQLPTVFPLPSLREALGGELVFMRLMIQQAKSLRELTGSPSDQTEPSPGQDAATATYPFLKDLYEERLLLEYVRLWPSLPAQPERWEQASEAMNAMQRRIDRNRSPLGMITQTLVPVYSGCGQIVGTMQTRKRLLECGADLAQARNETGAFPSGLKPNPESVDPFSGKPLHYRRVGKGFLLYGVGRDRKDDGGRRLPTKESRTIDDVLEVKS